MPQDRHHTVEGYWDCSYCGRKEIKGRQKSCPECGHARDASVKFYTKEIDASHAISREEFERQKDEAKRNSRSSSANYDGEQKAHEGPSLYSREEGEGRGDAHDSANASDWLCDYCGSYNPATTNVCSSCGATREMTKGETYAEKQGVYARTYDARGNLVKERDLSARAKVTPEVQAAGTGPNWLRLGAIALGVIAIIALVTMLFAPKTRDLEVAGFAWERTIAVERLETVNESDWELPSEGRLSHSEREIRRYDQVLDHYEDVPYEVSERVLDHYENYTTTVDNGDGTFDVEEHSEPVYRTEYRTEYRSTPIYRDVPVYDTKYYYEIERWVHARDVTTSEEDHEPYWGEVELSGPVGEHGTGQEREGARTGTYWVMDTDGQSYKADEDYWNGLELGMKEKVQVNGEHISPKK